MWLNLLIIFIIITSGLHYMQFEKVRYTSNSLGRPLGIITTPRKSYILFITLLLILQSGLRNVGVGADTYAYYEAFERVKELSWSEVFYTVSTYYHLGEGKDPGYLVFQKLFQYISGDYQVYLVFIATLFFSALAYFIHRNTKVVSDALFAFVLYSTLFYSFFSITGIRQTITTAAALWGYELIKRKKLLPFLLLILVASTIHKSTLIIIPLYFIRNKKAVKYLLISFVILLPLMFVFSSPISLFFKSMDDIYNEYERIPGLQPYNFVFFQLLIFLLGIITYKESLNQKHYPYTMFWYVALMLATFFTTQVFQVHGFMRVIYYFSIFNLLLIPHMIKLLAIRWKISNKELMFWCIILLVALYMKGAWGSDYGFFWQQIELGENYR